MLRPLNSFIKTLPASNAAIKNTASDTYIDGWYPAFSASGQDVWLKDYRYNCKAIIISAVGARCGKAFKADGKWNVCANTHILVVDEKIADRDYIWYLINDENWWIKGGTAQPFIKINESLKRSINLPSINEQKRIVSILDNLVKSIKDSDEQIAKLDNLIFSRFNDLFGDPILNNLKIATKPLSAVAPFNSVKNKMPINEQTWLLNLDVIESNTGKILEKQRTSSIPQSTIEFDTSCVLYSKLRPYLNKVVIPDESGFATSELVSMSCNPNVINRYYLATLLRHSSFVNYINSKTAGAKMPRANMDLLRTFGLPLPSLDLQNSFSEFVESITKLKMFAEKRKELFIELYNKEKYENYSDTNIERGF